MGASVRQGMLKKPKASLYSLVILCMKERKRGIWQKTPGSVAVKKKTVTTCKKNTEIEINL